MNNEEILTDFRRRWENTYLFLEKAEGTFGPAVGKEVLAHVSAVAASPEHLATLVLTTQKLGKLHINFDSDEYQLVFKTPPVGIFQCGKDVGFFRRRCERQYTRGICSANSVLASVPHRYAGNTLSLRLDTVQAAFLGATYTLPAALSGLQNGSWRSVALDNQFSLSLSLNKDLSDYVVWHWDIPIAKCNDKGQITVIYADVYKKVLYELFRA
jgi:hypothetical protein